MTHTGPVGVFFATHFEHMRQFGSFAQGLGSKYKIIETTGCLLHWLFNNDPYNGLICLI